MGVFATVAAVGVYVSRSALVTAVGSYLIVEDPLETADAIKVMAGDFPSVILEAVDLYNGGYGKWIVLAPETRPAAWDELERRGVDMPYSAERNVYAARALGVPEDAILVLGPPVQTTRQELGNLRGPLEERGIRSMIIVAIKTHTRRCRLIARELLEPHVRVIVRSSRYNDYDPSLWIRDRFFFKEAFVEYQKLLNDSFHVLGSRDGSLPHSRN